MDRLRALVFGTVLLLVVGWVLHVGKGILVPAVLGAVIVYVVVGMAQALGRLQGFAEAMRDQGYLAHNRVELLQERPASAAVARWLGVRHRELRW